MNENFHLLPFHMQTKNPYHLVASCIEFSQSSDTTNKNSDDESTTNINKRQLLPLPRAGKRSLTRTTRSDGMLPFPRAGRSSAQGILPIMRAGRSEGLMPFPRAGRSDGLMPFPRAGRSEGLMPFPRAGRSDGLMPFPRAGRSEGLMPFPRAGRSSEGLVPMPRTGRSDGLVPIMRAGRSDGLMPFPRAGRSDGMLPFPRAGRSDGGQGLLPMPRAGRSDPGMLPMPRAGRSLPSDCIDPTDCYEMHESNFDGDTNSLENMDSVSVQRFLDRSKRSVSLNESLKKDENATQTVAAHKNVPTTSENNSTEGTNEFILNGMTIVLKPSLIMNDDDDVIGRRLMERQWIEFEQKGFSFRYPLPSYPLLSMMPSGAPSSNFFSNSLEDEMEPSNLNPIDLQLRAVYIPRIGKRTMVTSYGGNPRLSTAEWLKRAGVSSTGPAFQPRIGRSSFFQPRTGRSGPTEDDDLNVDEVILDGRPARSSFTPRIGRSVKSQKPTAAKAK